MLRAGWSSPLRLRHPRKSELPDAVREKTEEEEEEGAGRRRRMREEKGVAGQDLMGSECHVVVSERLREVVQPVSLESSFQCRVPVAPPPRGPAVARPAPPRGRPDSGPRPAPTAAATAAATATAIVHVARIRSISIIKVDFEL